MAKKGKTISNNLTKQSVRFIQTAVDTGGQLLEMESRYLAHSKEPAMHYHPVQVEDFTVLEGELTVKMNDTITTLHAGDKLHIPAGTSHAMWNNSNTITVVNWQIKPALNTEYLLETITGLANDGKTNTHGIPNILQVALIGNRYGKVFRLSKPPYIVQKIVFTILSPFAWLMRYRSMYKKYID